MIASPAKGGGGGSGLGGVAGWTYARIANAQASATPHGSAIDVGDQDIEWTILPGLADSNPRNGSWYTLGIPDDILGNSIAGLSTPRFVEASIEVVSISGDGLEHLAIGLCDGPDYSTALSSTLWGLTHEASLTSIRAMMARLSLKSVFGGGPTIGDAVYGNSSTYLVSPSVPGFRCAFSQVFNAGAPTVFSSQLATPTGIIGAAGQDPHLVIIGGREGDIAAGTTVRAKVKLRVHAPPASVP